MGPHKTPVAAGLRQSNRNRLYADLLNLGLTGFIGVQLVECTVFNLAVVYASTRRPRSWMSFRALTFSPCKK